VGSPRGAAPLREIRQGLLTGGAGSNDVTPRVLSRELKALTTLGMVERKDFGTVPPRVEYALTVEGQSLVPVLSVVHKWGVQHLMREELLK
jgi:DNA-binding HxlR family transcriptional regulator